MLSWCKTYLKIRHCRKYLLNALDKINTKKKKSQFVIIEILEKKKPKTNCRSLKQKKECEKGKLCLLRVYFYRIPCYSSGFSTTIIIYFWLYLLRRSLVKILFCHFFVMVHWEINFYTLRCTRNLSPCTNFSYDPVPVHEFFVMFWK